MPAHRMAPLYASLFAAATLVGSASLADARPSADPPAAPPAPIGHVLLLSVDGLHAVDLAKYVAAHPASALARLSRTGVTYPNASTSEPSDSFPGLLSLVTGGSPRSTGVYYDDSYDRTLSAPGSDCSVKGTEVVYDESIDLNPDALDAGGGIDPAKLPRDPARGCAPVYPHSFLRVNTLFEVVKAAGLRTAWSDKHPAYELVNGPSGHGVDDLYTPEVAADGDYTTSEAAIQTYDELKVQAILDEIDGKDHTGTRAVGVPAVFGMNFQAVSVGQKLPTGGYADAAGTPTGDLVSGLDYVDGAIGRLRAALDGRGLLDSTVIIVTTKHGQAPIDRSLLRRLGHPVPATVNGVQPGLVAQATEDDVSLLWLSDQAQTGAAVAALQAAATADGIQSILSGRALRDQFGDPLADPRAPDIIVLPQLGVIYTTSTKKIAEHGGFNREDTNVALLVSSPRLKAKTLSPAVRTTQVAATILQLLGLDPGALQAARVEHTHALPGLEGLGRGPR